MSTSQVQEIHITCPYMLRHEFAGGVSKRENVKIRVYFVMMGQCAHCENIRKCGKK